MTLEQEKFNRNLCRYSLLSNETEYLVTGEKLGMESI